MSKHSLGSPRSNIKPWLDIWALRGLISEIIHKMQCAVDWWHTTGQNPQALLLFWGFNPYSCSYLWLHTEAAAPNAALPLSSANKSNVLQSTREIFIFQIKTTAGVLQKVRTYDHWGLASSAFIYYRITSVIMKMIVLISAHMLFNHNLGQAPSQGNHIQGPSAASVILHWAV